MAEEEKQTKTLLEVGQELQSLNSTADIQFEAQLEMMSAQERLVSLQASANECLGEIKQSLHDLLNHGINTIVEGFNDALEAKQIEEEKLAALQEKMTDREEDEKEDKRPDKIKQFDGTYFAEAIKKMTKTQKALLDGFGKFRKTIGLLGRFFTVIAVPAIVGMVKALALPIAVIVTAVAGIIEAVDMFKKEAGSLPYKLLSAFEGFLVGAYEFIMLPFEWVLDKLGGLFGIENLGGDTISVVVDTIRLLFNIIEDVWQGVGVMVDWIGEKIKPAIDGIKAAWEMVGNGIEEFKNTLIDWYNSIVKYIPGLDPIEKADASAEEKDDEPKMTREERSDLVRDARSSGLYDSNVIGDSTIDRDMVEKASTRTLQALLADDDMNEEDTKFVQDVIEKRKSLQEVEVTAKPIPIDDILKPVSVDAQKVEMTEDQQRMARKAMLVQALTEGDAPMKAAAAQALAKEFPMLAPAVEQVTNITQSEAARQRQMEGSGGPDAPRPAPSAPEETTVLQDIAGDIYNRESTAFKTDTATRITKVLNDKTGGMAERLGINRRMISGGVDTVFGMGEDAVKGEGPGIMGSISNSLTNFFGGGDSQNRTEELASRREALESTVATTNNTAGGNVAVVDNSVTDASQTTNIVGSAPISPVDKSDRTHLRGAYRGT